VTVDPKCAGVGALSPTGSPVNTHPAIVGRDIVLAMRTEEVKVKDELCGRLQQRDTGRPRL